MNYNLHTKSKLRGSQSIVGSMALLGGSVQVQCAPTNQQKEQADCVLR